MNYPPVIIGIGALAACAGLVLAFTGMRSLVNWVRARPIQSAVAAFALSTLVIGVWATQDGAWNACWPKHKFRCFLPK